MITVTESAKKQAIRLMEDDGKKGFFIRVGVEGGGCSGLMYQLTFDNERKEGDSSFEDNGIEVVVDTKSYLYLLGTTLDFSGGLNGKGFVFKNPNECLLQHVLYYVFIVNVTSHRPLQVRKQCSKQFFLCSAVTTNTTFNPILFLTL